MTFLRKIKSWSHMLSLGGREARQADGKERDSGSVPGEGDLRAEWLSRLRAERCRARGQGAPRGEGGRTRCFTGDAAVSLAGWREKELR